MTKNQSTRIETLDNVYITAQVLAELWRVTPDMIGKYAREYGMPKAGHGRYLLKDCIQWYVDRLRITAAGGENNDVAEEKLKLTRAQRQRAEIENKKARDELIAFEAVAEVLNGMAGTYSSQLDGFGARVAATLAGMDDPAAIQRVLFDECRAIRTTTARAAQNFAANFDSGNDNRAATEP